MSMHQRGFLDFSAPRPDLRPFVEDDSAISWQSGGVGCQTNGCAAQSDLISVELKLTQSQAKILEVMGDARAGRADSFAMSQVLWTHISQEEWSAVYATVVDLIGVQGAAWIGIVPDKPTSDASTLGGLIMMAVMLLLVFGAAAIAGAARPSCCKFLDSSCDYTRECQTEVTGEKGYWCQGADLTHGASWSFNGVMPPELQSSSGNASHCKPDCCTVADIADGKPPPLTTLAG